MIKIPREKVAVIPMENPDKIGHIYIPEMAQGRTQQGIIKYVGADVRDLAIGMHVMYSPYSGTLIQLEGEGKLIIIHSDFIAAELPDEVSTDIPGLYFRGNDGQYYMANYELGMEFIARAIGESDWGRSIRFKNQERVKPEIVASGKMRGG